jgi:hypothetical protein
MCSSYVDVEHATSNWRSCQRSGTTTFVFAFRFAAFWQQLKKPVHFMERGVSEPLALLQFVDSWQQQRTKEVALGAALSGKLAPLEVTEGMAQPCITITT